MTIQKHSCWKQRSDAAKPRPMPNIRFPLAWPWFFDETLPAWVKNQYSPRDSWKDKPFSEADAQFFTKGILELSELFTDERPKSVPTYFNHPKFRSSYLLYFLPLQASKFTALFQMHGPALAAALAHAKETGVLRVADLGSGPGTASIALLLELLQKAAETQGFEIPPVEFDWFDTHRGILEDGRALVEQIAAPGGTRRKS